MAKKIEILISEVDNGYILEFDPDNDRMSPSGEEKIFVAKTGIEVAKLVGELCKKITVKKHK